MISKHVDFIAVGVLLAAAGLLSSAKHVVVMTFSGPVHYLRMDAGREVQVPVMPRMPKVPQMPKIQLQRD